MKEKDSGFPPKPCVVCGKQTMPWCFTHNWGHICSKKCWEIFDKNRFQPPTSEGH